MVEAVPTRLMRPASSASRPATIARQVADADFGTVASWNSQSGKYLPFKTRAHRELGLVMKRHPCFPSSARLNKRRSRKPIPPLHFSVANLSHDIHCIEHLSMELLQKNFAIPDVRVLHTFLVRRKPDMLKVGIAWITDFRSASLAAQASSRSDHPCMFARARSAI